MSTGQSSFRAGRDYRVGGSRHTNLDNSVTPAEGGNSAVSDDRELPHPADRAAEFIEEYPDRADLPLTRQNGRSIRAELLDREYETHYVEAQEPTEDGHLVTEQVYANPCTWGEAVYQLLKDHDETRNTTIHLERGRPDDPEHATHDIPATNRWMHDYQKRYYAELKAWMRELCGGERPSGNVTPASFDDPHIVLLSRGASSIPDGDRLAPIDHADSIRESWTDCYHTLRNRLRAKGYDLGDDWQYDRRLEPHTGERGGGANWCYPHEHAVIVVDGNVSPSDFRPVVEKHVDSCEYAGESAHDLDIEDWDSNRDDVNTVTIKPADEVENLAQYVASYTGIKPVDLLERSTEYIAFAAVYWASFSKTITRSDAARHAATADACRQRYESAQSDQEHDHGEEIRREEIRGQRVLVCAECGSPHDIDQEQTLSAARLDDSSTTVAADGGLDREEDLRERWPSARSAARVGESPSRARDREQIEQYVEQNPEAGPPEILGALQLPEDRLDLVDEVLYDLDSSELVSFERPPEWRVEAITVADETHDVTEPSGIDLEPVELGGGQLANWITENSILSDLSGHISFDGVAVSIRAASWKMAQLGIQTQEQIQSVLKRSVSVHPATKFDNLRPDRELIRSNHDHILGTS